MEKFVIIITDDKTSTFTFPTKRACWSHKSYGRAVVTLKTSGINRRDVSFNFEYHLINCALLIFQFFFLWEY